jgi:hypothetical protein
MKGYCGTVLYGRGSGTDRYGNEGRETIAFSLDSLLNSKLNKEESVRISLVLELCSSHSIQCRNKVTTHRYLYLRTLTGYFITTRGGRNCAERQFIMGTSRKRKASPSGDLINHTNPKQAPFEPKIGKRPEIVMLISL